MEGNRFVTWRAREYGGFRLPAGAAGRPQAFRVSGLQRALGTLRGELTEPERVDRDRALGRLARLHRVIESGMAWRGLARAELTGPTREALGWVAYFRQPANLDRYLAAVAEARAAFRAAGADRRRCPTPLRVEFRPQSAVGWLRVERGGSGSSLCCATPAVALETAGFVALAAHLLHGRGKRALHEAMCAPGYQGVAAELDALAGCAEPTAGRWHDLAESFARVSGRLFGGTLDRPALAWSHARGRRVFARCDLVADRIVVHRRLDAPDVSAATLDFVLYHELLHRRHGIRWAGERARTHTAAFRREERRFPGWAAAEAELERLAGERARGPTRAPRNTQGDR